MDIYQAARRFDLDYFEEYDFTAGGWSGNFVVGQLKRGDQFLSIYHRPTRKRMLFVDNNNVPSSAVIRTRLTGEIFMLGSQQGDIFDDVHYRNIFALHKPAGKAVVSRLVTSGPPTNPGWGVRTVMENTFADVEIRSLNENEDASLFHHGHVFITMPNNTIVEPHDTVTIGGLLPQSYYVLERYVDSSLIAVRAVARGDERVNVTYHEITGKSYANQQVVQLETVRNITARVAPIAMSDLPNDVSSDTLKVMVEAAFLGITPKLGDYVTYLGLKYDIRKIYRDPLANEWHLTVAY